MLDAVNHNRSERQFVCDPLSQRIPDKFTILSRLREDAVQRIETGNWAVFWVIHAPVELLMVVVHGPDRRNNQAADRNFFAQIVNERIRSFEQQRQHRRTFVVGDFNMHPYEDGMMSAGMFHASTTQRTAQRGERQVQGGKYPLFYNPMWGLFGDRTPGPAGTYYDDSPGTRVECWSMLDQVIIRSDLVPYFQSVEILTGIGNDELLTEHGLPDGRSASDHLPLLFSFEFPEGEVG